MSKGKYYVYHVELNNEIIYIGKGQGTRYKHATSGSSHSTQLNRYWFRHELLGEEAPVVTIVHTFEDEVSALSKEEEDIGRYTPICNIRGNSTFVGTASNRVDLVSLEEFISFAKDRDDGRRLLYHRKYYCKDPEVVLQLQAAIDTIPDKRVNNGGYNKGFGGKYLNGSTELKQYGRFKRKFIITNGRTPTEEESFLWLDNRNKKKLKKINNHFPHHERGNTNTN